MLVLMMANPQPHIVVSLGEDNNFLPQIGLWLIRITIIERSDSPTGQEKPRCIIVESDFSRRLRRSNVRVQFRLSLFAPQLRQIFRKSGWAFVRYLLCESGARNVQRSVTGKRSSPRRSLSRDLVARAQERSKHRRLFEMR